MHLQKPMQLHNIEAQYDAICNIKLLFMNEKDTVANFQGVIPCWQALGVVPLRDASIEFPEVGQG